jgi:hypothetical protein
MDTGDPMAGVAGDAFALGEATVFLDGSYEVLPQAPATTSSGVAIALNVTSGLHEIESALTEHQFFGANVRIDDSVVSIVDVDVGVDPPELPAGMSFEGDVMTVFEQRGCNNCHQGNGPGRQQGGFSLNGSPEARHAEVLLRVDLDNPEQSIFLRKPSFEDPPDGHQSVFANQYDADYMKLLSWIEDGAPR